MALKHQDKLSGDIGWLLLISYIVTYDALALYSNKTETLSSALWRSLSHPYKSPVAMALWGCLTWHLFGNPNARQSYQLRNQMKRKINGFDYN